jgi:hypothetical protein
VYPHLDTATVHYNPARPADAVLRPCLWLTLAANVLIGIGCGAALPVSASGMG